MNKKQIYVKILVVACQILYDSNFAVKHKKAIRTLCMYENSFAGNLQSWLWL